MPRRKKVALLPPDVRRELDRKLIEGAFSGYADLAEWLRGKGHEIGKSALHDYGSHLERRIERIRHATESAEALVAASPDNTAAMADASLRMVQEEIYNLLLAAEQGDMKRAASAARALAEVARASVSIRRERRQILREAAEAAASEARKLGLSGGVAAALRAAVEGADR